MGGSGEGDMQVSSLVSRGRVDCVKINLEGELIQSDNLILTLEEARDLLRKLESLVSDKALSYEKEAEKARERGATIF